MKCPKLSASRGKLFKQCPFAYFLKYYIKIDRGSLAMHTGSFVHMVFENISKRQDYYIDINKKVYSKNRINILIEECIQDKNFLEKIGQFSCMINEIKEKGTDIIYKYLDKENCKLYDNVLCDKNNKCIEMCFDTITGNNVPILGYIDVILKYNNHTIMVNDYKTGSTVPKYYDLANDLQTKMYFYVAKKMFPEYKNIIVNLDYCKKFKNIVNTYPSVDIIEKEIKNIYDRIVNYKLSNDILRNRSWKCKVMCIGAGNCYQIYHLLRKSNMLNEKYYLENYNEKLEERTNS